MATAESVKGKIQGLIDSANAATGNTDADLSTAVGSLIVGFGQGGSNGGGIETGEFVSTASTYWAFSIPVSSKKSRFVILPKSFSDMWAQDNTNRERIIVAIEGIGHVQCNPGNPTESTEITAGVSRWYFAGDPGNTVVFNEDSINVSVQYSPWAIGEYYWFAW